MGGKDLKSLISLEETSFIVSSWEEEAGGKGRPLRSALMLACLFAFCFLDPHPGGWTHQLWNKHNRMAISSLQTRRQQMLTMGVGGTSIRQTRENLKG